MDYQNMTKEDLIKALEAAKASRVRDLTLKISEKGALSVYGLGRFPVTLYKSQWHRLLGKVNAISEFLAVNDDKLVDKQ